MDHFQSACNSSITPLYPLFLTPSLSSARTLDSITRIGEINVEVSERHNWFYDFAWEREGARERERESDREVSMGKEKPQHSLSIYASAPASRDNELLRVSIFLYALAVTASAETPLFKRAEATRVSIYSTPSLSGRLQYTIRVCVCEGAASAERERW